MDVGPPAFPRRCLKAILGAWLDIGGGTSVIGQEVPSLSSREEQMPVPNSGPRKGASASGSFPANALSCSLTRTITCYQSYVRR